MRLIVLILSSADYQTFGIGSKTCINFYFFSMKKEGFGRGCPFEIGDIAQNNNDFEILKKFSVEFYNWLIRSGASTKKNDW